MAILTLGKGTIQTTPERDAYNALRLKYQDLADKVKQNFSDRFSSHFSNMDQLHLNCTMVVNQYLNDPIDQAIRDLITIGIMDVDDEQFRNKFLAPYSSWITDFAEVDDKYLSIILKAEELANYKAARRDSGGVGIIGGGFGLEGAAAGIATATAANVAIGVVGGVFNLGADALSAMGDKVQKWSLFKDPKTKTHLAESLGRLIFQVHLAVVNAAALHQKSVYHNISDEDKIKAKSLFVNISKGRISGETTESYLIDSISLNPYEPDSYLLWFNLYGDSDGNLSKVALHFGIREVLDLKRKMLLQYKENLKISTVEECEASLVYLENYAKKIGYQDIVVERAKMLIEIDRLKVEQRTFNGVIYETQEEVQAHKDEVQAQTEELWKTVDGVHYPTIEKANEIRAKKQHVGFFLGLSIVILPLPNALLTLQDGYSVKARLLAITWIVIFVLILVSQKLPMYELFAILIGLTLLGLLVMPFRILLDNLLDMIRPPSSQNPPSYSSSTKAEKNRKVVLWISALVVLLSVSYLIPSKEKLEKELKEVKPSEKALQTP